MFFLLIWDANEIQLKHYWFASSSLSLNFITKIGQSCCRPCTIHISNHSLQFCLDYSCLLPPSALRAVKLPIGLYLPMLEAINFSSKTLPFRIRILSFLLFPKTCLFSKTNTANLFTIPRT